MYGSILLYITVLAGGICLAKRAEDTQKKLYVWAIILCLTLLAGFRGSSVGIDTVKYIENFGHIAAGNLNLVYGAEQTFIIIVQILQLISQSPIFLLLVFSFATNALILFRLWDFRKNISFIWAFIYFYTSFYFFTFNIVRQMLAVAIIFWATGYVQREKYTKFLVFVAIAFLFHQSALLGIVYIAFDLLQKEKWQRNKKLFMAFLCVGVLGCGFVLLKAAKYIHYFTETTVNLGYLVPLKLCFLGAYVCAVKLVSGKWGGKRLQGRLSFMNVNVVAYYGLGLLISLLGYFYQFMDRISLYFGIFGCVFIGHVAKRAKHPLLVRCIYALLIGLPFAMDLFSGGQGQLPYAFFWQK